LCGFGIPGHDEDCQQRYDCQHCERLAEAPTKVFGDLANKDQTDHTADDGNTGEKPVG